MTIDEAHHDIDVPLPDSLQVVRHGQVAVVRICREAKRNALDDATVLGLERFFSTPPAWARAVVLDSEGAHFSLKGAVIGGGLELASATHLRVAESSAFYALPEGQHGLFVGGGGSVRVPRLIGVHRMADMMLTGRVVDAGEGQAIRLSHYLVDEGNGLAKALQLAERIAGNAPITNFAVLQALPQIAEASPAQGYLLEALMASVAGGSDEAKELMAAFLAGRGGKVERG